MGAQGALGPVGLVGPKGAVGDAGPTGAAGPAGARGIHGTDGTIGYTVVTSPAFTWDGLATGFLAAPRCPAGTVIVDAEISADGNVDDFVVKYKQYTVVGSESLPRAMTTSVYNSNAAARDVKITSICLSYR